MLGNQLPLTVGSLTVHLALVVRSYEEQSEDVKQTTFIQVRTFKCNTCLGTIRNISRTDGWMSDFDDSSSSVHVHVSGGELSFQQLSFWEKPIIYQDISIQITNVNLRKSPVRIHYKKYKKFHVNPSFWTSCRLSVSITGFSTSAGASSITLKFKTQRTISRRVNLTPLPRLVVKNVLDLICDFELWLR